MQYIDYSMSKLICKIYIYIKIIGFQKFLLKYAINKENKYIKRNKLNLLYYQNRFTNMIHYFSDFTK